MTPGSSVRRHRETEGGDAWLMKNRSDHPLADEKGAKEFLSELPSSGSLQDPGGDHLLARCHAHLRGLQAAAHLRDHRSARPGRQAAPAQAVPGVPGRRRAPAEVPGAAHLEHGGRVLAPARRGLRVLPGADPARRVRLGRPQAHRADHRGARAARAGAGGEVGPDALRSDRSHPWGRLGRAVRAGGAGRVRAARPAPSTPARTASPRCSAST